MSIGLVDERTKPTALQRLASEITGWQAARSKLDRMRADTAYDGALSQQVEECRRSVDEWRATLAHSKLAKVAHALGEPDGLGVPIGDARQGLQDAEDELITATEARDTVIGLIPEAESRLSGLEWRVDAAADVLMTARLSPHTRDIWQWHARLQREAAEAEQIVRHLLRHKFIGPSHMPMLAVNAFDAALVWKRAEAALRSDANAKSPAIPGVESLASKR